jgi:hypothetical protein
VRYKSFRYEAASWSKTRRIVSKVEYHAGKLFPRVGFLVTNDIVEPFGGEKPENVLGEGMVGEVSPNVAPPEPKRGRGASDRTEEERGQTWQTGLKTVCAGAAGLTMPYASGWLKWKSPLRRFKPGSTRPDGFSMLTKGLQG